MVPRHHSRNIALVCLVLALLCAGIGFCGCTSPTAPTAPSWWSLEIAEGCPAQPLPTPLLLQVVGAHLTELAPVAELPGYRLAGKFVTGGNFIAAFKPSSTGRYRLCAWIVS